MPENDQAIAALQKRNREAMRPDFCFRCAGGGKLQKRDSELTETERGMAMAGFASRNVKDCPDCSGTGLLDLGYPLKKEN